MSELEPCPHCGGEAEIIEESEGHVMTYYVVECKGCHCNTGWCDSRKDAEKIWNRRATSKENKPQQLCAEDENFIQTKYGYCFYTLDSQPLIYNLYVYPQYRHHGYSRILLELVISEIRKRDKRKIYIQAKPRENSINLEDLTKYYQNMGLTVCATHKPEGK